MRSRTERPRSCPVTNRHRGGHRAFAPIRRPSCRVTSATVTVVTENSETVAWTVLAVRLPAEPSRHRVAVWRELRRAGALPLSQGVWALPATPAFAHSLDRAVELIARGRGEALLLEARGRDDAQARHLESLFTSAREDEWVEFISECAKYDAELDHEIAQGKLTVAELDE